MEKIKVTSDVDTEIGRRIKAERNAIGMSQADLGARCGITFQQLQKYEKGVNRLSVARLVQISEGLQIPVSRILQGLGFDPEPADDVPLESRALGRLACDLRAPDSIVAVRNLVEALKRAESTLENAA